MGNNVSEKLEARAKTLNVSVRSLKACDHPESLIYFDTVYGQQQSWQVCDYCEQTFNVTALQQPGAVIDPHDYLRTP